MDVDLWGWFDRFYWDAWRSGDSERLRIVHLYHAAWDHMEGDPRQAITYLEQGKAQAAKLGEPCWMLFYDYWLSEAHLFYLDDVRAGLDRAVKTAVEARKPIYQHCPVRARVYRILIDAYMVLDPVGYVDKIRETSDYMEKEIPQDDDTRYLTQARKARLAFVFDKLDEAFDEALRFLAMSEDSDFQQTYAYSLLCQFSYLRGDLEAALQYALDGEITARRCDRRASVAALLAWQALLRHKLGEPELAAALYRQAVARTAALGIVPYEGYYEAACEYLELIDKPEEAFRLREQQLAEALTSSSPYSICECRLKRCQLLKRMGERAGKNGLPTLAEELAAAREAAKLLIAPAYLLEKLEKL